MSQASLERQIRPIYDALDTGSNKTAILACNKMLKKYPKLDLVKALKALAVVRTNKIEEALPLCDEVLATKPTDLDILTALMHVLRALGRHTDMVNMFDDAYKKLPGNEELGAQSFFANVRTGNWKTAQQIATKMHKAFKGDRYLYWSVIGAVLQARENSTPPATRSILYKLAHRLLGGTLQPSHISADRFHLHLTVLRELELYDEAHAHLSSTEGIVHAKTSLVVEELRKEFVQLRGAWSEEGTLAESKIVERKDRNWAEFLAVLDSTFCHVVSPAKPDDQPCPDADQRAKCLEHITKSRQIFSHLADTDVRKDRAPLLALVDLEWRSRKYGLSEDPNAIVDLLTRYFETFGDKSCCFEDLRKYEEELGEQSSNWRKFLEGYIHSNESVSLLTRSINIHKLLRHILVSSELNPDEELARSTKYLKQYFAALPLGKELPDTELQPADDLLIMAAQGLVGIWSATGDLKFLSSAAVVLEYGLTKSKHSYLMRLHLVRIYRLLGAPSVALSHYRGLNVKQIQNDTLSHHMLARISTYSLASTGDLTYPQECLEASQIYISNSSETSDFIVRAFAAEKYSQIPDFITFEDRLDNSLQRDLIKVEHVRMRLTHEAIVPDTIDAELIELKFIFDRAHHDNRDFDVIPNYQPKASPKTFQEQTLMFGSSPSLGWLTSFLRIYIRVLQQASDLDDAVEEKLLIGDRPKMSGSPECKLPLKERLPELKDAELKELTTNERALFDYTMALCEWLGPYHDHARPHPATVLAEATKAMDALTKSKSTGNGNGNGNGSTVSGSHGNGDGHTPVIKKLDEPPAVKDAPEKVAKFFNVMLDEFKSIASRAHLPWELLHVATLIKEAVVLQTIGTLRFKSPAVIKSNKFGPLTHALKDLRTESLSTLKEVSTELVKLGEQTATSETRRAFVSQCEEVFRGLDEIKHDFIMDIAKKVTDSRKRVLEGVGKGAAKVAQNHGNGAATPTVV